MSRLKELREQRLTANAKAVEFLKVVPQTDETRSSYAKAMKDVDDLGTDIANIERADKVEAELRAQGGDPTRNVGGNDQITVEERAKRYRKAWSNALRTQPNFISGGTQGKIDAKACKLDAVEARYREMLDAENTRLAGVEARDLAEGNLLSQIGTYTGIGFFVPAGFVYDIEQATKYFAPLLDGSVIRVMETATGQPLPYPTSNDTNQQATIVGENVAVPVQDVTAGHINFGAYKFSSGLVKVSLELLQDSAFDLQAWLVQRFAERWGRGLENFLTNGTGVNQPTGLITSILASGVTPIIAAGSSESTGGAQTGVNSVGYSDLVNLEHSVDPTYRRNAKYMFHDQTLSALRKVLDKYGRPLWTPSVREGDPDRINGYQYVINQSIPQIGAASSNTVIFGAFEKYMARKVKDLQVMRLDERFADQGQVGFISFARLDANLVDAGTHPLNILQQHS